MKAKFYLYVSMMGWLAACFIVQKTAAQCNCGVSGPATAIIQTYTLPPTYGNAIITFNKFDPSIGTLSCATIEATVAGSTTTDVFNNHGQNKYKFSLQLTPELSGPGFDIDSTFTKPYGPDSLYDQHYIDSAHYGSNTITYGPDSLFTNDHQTSNISAGHFIDYYTDILTPVQLNYTINGGLTSTSGGANFTSTITTQSAGTFTLTYYWCPLSPLASGIKNFTTNLKNNYILVKWFAQNQTANTTYELQVSTDGKNFKTVYVQPVQLANGSSTNYQYSYSTDGISADKLYFRIKQTEASGKISYSVINSVSLTGGNQQATVAVYPNPVVNKFSLQFDRPVSGDYSISLVSATGQQVFSRILQLNNTNLASVDMGSAPPSGLYYLRAIDQKTGTVYTNKLLVK